MNSEPVREADIEAYIAAELEAYVQTAEINHQRLHHLDVLLSAFESCGIEVLLLKGADLLGRAYRGTLGLRWMADVDLLFHREDLPDIKRIVTAHGFQPRVDGNPSYASPAHGLSLDMISELWYRNDLDAVWKRSVPRQVAGRVRPAMHPEDALIYLVAYETIHRGQLSLQMARDVAALLEAEGPCIDWHHLVHEINHCRLTLPLSHGFSYAREQADAKIPSWVLDALRPPTSQHRLTAFLYQRLVQERRVVPQLGYFLLIFSRPGWINKLQTLWKTFFPSQEFLTFRYGKRTRWARCWIRITRPAALVFRGGRLLFRMACRLVFPPQA